MKWAWSQAEVAMASTVESVVSSAHLLVGPEYKIILLGEPGVGKTSYFYRLRDNVFLGDGCSTVCTGVEHLDHVVTIDGVEVKASVYDTAGGERFRTLTSNYFANADAAILMYSIEDRYSFERVQDEIENCMQFIEPEEFVWGLLGNKSDLALEVEESCILSKGEQLGTSLIYFTSAKTGFNVTSSLNAVIKQVHRKRAGIPRSNSKGWGATPIIKSSLQTRKKSSCC